MRKDGKKIPDASKGDGEAPPNELRTVSRRALITGAAATAGSVMTVGAARGLGIEQSSLDQLAAHLAPPIMSSMGFLHLPIFTSSVTITEFHRSIQHSTGY